MNNKKINPIIRSNSKFSVAVDSEGNGVAVGFFGGEIVPFFSTEAIKDWDQREIFKNLFMKAKHKYNTQDFALKKHVS